MAANDHVDYPVYDGDSGESIQPHLPSIGNLGGDEKQNDPVLPPNPLTMPDARDHIQIVSCVAAHGRVTASATISIDYSAGVPFVYGAKFRHSTMSSGDLTITEVATGHVRIAWPVDSFPASTLHPFGLTINEDTAVNEPRAWPAVANSIDVKTFHNGAGVEAAFTVQIDGQSG